MKMPRAAIASFWKANWFKINSDDPERVVLALWAGLHQPGDESKWAAPFTVHQLHKLVDPSNAEEIIDAISKALRVYAVKKKQRQMMGSPSPANGSSAPTMTTTSSPSESPNSGPLPASTSDSVSASS